jgi:hypothetical protein
MDDAYGFSSTWMIGQLMILLPWGEGGGSKTCNRSNMPDDTRISTRMCGQWKHIPAKRDGSSIVKRSKSTKMLRF